MYAWWLELVGNDALLDSWQKLDSDKKKLETTEPTTHWNADSLYLSISSSHWSLGNAWPAVCADLFSEVSLSCLSIFHTETSKVQVANFPAVRHYVVSLRCLAAIVQHVPRNFAHLKRLCGYAECCCILIRFQVYYANLYYTRIQKIQWTHMGTRLSFLKLHVSIQIGLNIWYCKPFRWPFRWYQIRNLWVV